MTLIFNFLDNDITITIYDDNYHLYLYKSINSSEIVYEEYFLDKNNNKWFYPVDQISEINKLKEILEIWNTIPSSLAILFYLNPVYGSTIIKEYLHTKGIKCEILK